MLQQSHVALGVLLVIRSGCFFCQFPNKLGCISFIRLRAYSKGNKKNNDVD